MKLISWNVNGIRAWYKKGSYDWFIKQSPDFMCIQETKAHPEQLEKDFPALFAPKGYFAYFDSAKIRKGYSGIAVYTKHKPEKVTYGLGKKELDQEGRQVNVFYKNYVVISGYFPNGNKSKDHFQYKLDYYAEFLKFIKRLEKRGYKVIFCGDLNVAHNPIDLERDKENEKSVGFLPIEREWVDSLELNGFVDTFRASHPNKVQYSWWDMKTYARERNIGWRIDYFFVSKTLNKKINRAEILDKVLGSDHCPILLDVDIK
jgi:exodeoxyribonuclease-3